MKSRKIEDSYTYEGFGFPLVLHNVPMIEVRGVWTLDINLNKLERFVRLSFAHQPWALTGDQIRFIRSSMKLSQRDFANLFGVTHAAVVKWEKTCLHPAKMNVTTQVAIRLKILDDLLKEDKAFREAYRSIVSLEFEEHSFTPLEIDPQKDLIAI